MIVWQDGNFIPEEEVRISPFDPGFVLGQGCFETMLGVDGKVERLHLHLERLRQTLGARGWSESEITRFRDPSLQAETGLLLRRNGLGRGRARVKLMVSSETTILTAVREKEVASSVSLAVVDCPVNVEAGVSRWKMTSYAENLRALELAKAAGEDDALRLNTRGEICEASMANIFWETAEGLFTPSLSTGCLPGITRHLFLEEHPDTRLVEAGLDALRGARKMWLTSSIRGVQEVSRWVLK